MRLNGAFKNAIQSVKLFTYQPRVVTCLGQTSKNFPGLDDAAGFKTLCDIENTLGDSVPRVATIGGAAPRFVLIEFNQLRQGNVKTASEERQGFGCRVRQSRFGTGAL